MRVVLPESVWQSLGESSLPGSKLGKGLGEWARLSLDELREICALDSVDNVLLPNGRAEALWILALFIISSALSKSC